MLSSWRGCHDPRVALGFVGVLALLAAVSLQLYRFTLDPMPVRAGPVVWLLTLGWLSGVAWALLMARTAGRGRVTEDDRPLRDHRDDGSGLVVGQHGLHPQDAAGGRH